MATIRTATDKVPATVAAFGKVKPSQFGDGDYQSVLFESDRLPDGKVWRSMKPEEAKQFQRGQRVHLVPTTNKKGNPSWDIELLGDAPATAPQPEQQLMLSDIQRYTQKLINLYADCFARASEALDGADAETIRTCANATFYSAMDHFGLK